MEWRKQAVLTLACLALLCWGGCSGDDDGGGVVRLDVENPVPAAVGAGEIVEAVVSASGEDGAPRGGVEVVFTVERGGGRIDAAVTTGVGPEPRVVTTAVRTEADGSASVRWVAGIVPVPNRLSASVGDDAVVFETRVVLGEPLQAQPFGDIPQFLRETGYVATGPGGEEIFLATTEDLAFAGPDRMLLGLAAGTTAVEGALAEVDATGEAALLDLGGDALVGPLGVAVDRGGNLWVADPRGTAAGALLRVSPDGVVTTATTTDGENPLDAPNYVAVGPAGRIYVSDPCAGIVFRYDPDAGAVDAVLATDVATQGGANGLAFDASGEHLYFATENIALLCGRPDLDLTDPIAGLFRVPIDAAGFGAIEPLAERQGLFGDGLAFDAEGNLYVIFDTQADFMLEESAVWVLPAGESELVRFLATGEKVYANLAWGSAAFGEETIYIALLAVDAFGLPVRGVERIEIGIPGLPLLPD